MAEPKNILIFLTDDHAQWALGCYGNEEIRTPNMDHLAERGVRMMNAVTPSPVCSPARASLLTGRIPSQHGVHDYLASTDEEIGTRDWLGDEQTLAQILSDAGYQVGHSGKWHLGNAETPQPGFEFWFSQGRGYPVLHGGPHHYSFQGEQFTWTGRKTRIITDYGIRFLRERDAERPFCLFVNHTSTHSSWNDHPERLVSGYRNCSFEGVLGDAMYPFGKQNLESTEETRNEPREALAQYYASVTQIDESIGRMMDELEAQGLMEDTLIVYVSDHGLNCGQHGIWGKGNGTLPLNMVEESIRVPLIFHHPDFFYPQERAEFVDHTDLFQTLLAFAGAEAPDSGAPFPGRSLLPLLENRPYEPWRTVQFGEYGNLRMVKTQQYKLVRRYPDGPNELFDLERDPRETTSYFEDPNYRGIVAELTEQIEDFFGRYQDSEKSGLRVKDLPRHNFTEAWRP
jgi:arylsulfatase A-like enzyme